MSQQASPGLLASLSAELADVVAAVGPSVVRIDDGSRLTATGTIWSPDGVVVATSHGVERDEDVAVQTADGTRYPATVVGRDPDTDLAVLKVQAAGLPAAQRAGADDARIGHFVLALGRPGDAGLQATIGIVSARIETQTAGQPGYLVYTDAVLYPGFSGGPLVDTAGRVVGISNLIYGRGRGVAVGTPVVSQVVQALLSHGTVQRSYLGIRVQGAVLPAGLRQGLGLAQETAILTLQVEPASPAEQAGLLMGDVITRIADRAIADVDDLRAALRGLRVGEPVAVQVIRGGELKDVTVTPAAEDAAGAAAREVHHAGHHDHGGHHAGHHGHAGRGGHGAR